MVYDSVLYIGRLDGWMSAISLESKRYALEFRDDADKSPPRRTRLVLRGGRRSCLLVMIIIFIAWTSAPGRRLTGLSPAII